MTPLEDPSSRPILFLPGPTEVDPSVLAAMASFPISHRGAAIRSLIGDLDGRLQRLLGTTQPVLLLTTSATGVMEAAVRCTVRIAEQRPVLHLVAGAFGRKWSKISQSLGLRTVVEEVPAGSGFTPQAVKNALARADFDAVCITHNETSTGAFQADLPAIARTVREHSDALLLVDAVSSLAGTPIDFDAWGLDLVLAGVQKAMALPAGLSVCAVSERAYQRMESVPHRGTAFDLLLHRDNLRELQTPATPSTAHLFALRRQLERMEEETFERRYARHRALAERSRDFARRHFRLFPQEPFLSPTVTCVAVPPGFAVTAFRDAVRARGFELGGGYGDLKATTFRIGHMGEHDLPRLEALLGAMQGALEAMR